MILLYGEILVYHVLFHAFIILRLNTSALIMEPIAMATQKSNSVQKNYFQSFFKNLIPMKNSHFIDYAVILKRNVPPNSSLSIDDDDI